MSYQLIQLLSVIQRGEIPPMVMQIQDGATSKY